MTPTAPPRSKAVSFRTKLLLSMTLVMGGATGVAMYVSQRSAEAEDHSRLKHQFEGEMGWQIGIEEARRIAIAERCQTLSKSVRIRAALQEGELEDLHRNAEVELRDVLQSEQEDDSPRLLSATDFRFLDITGQAIPVSRADEGKEEPWRAQLGLSGPPEKQENAYVVLKDSEGQEFISEVIITPVTSTVTGQVMAALALFLPPVHLRTRGETIMERGILLEGRIFAGKSGPEIAEAMGRVLGPTGEGVVLQAAGQPYMAFSHLLNPNSACPPARLICLYPISALLEQRRQRQWKIAGMGAVCLLLGLGVSSVLATRLSKPVELLEEDSAINVAQRRQAEVERDLTEQKYQSIFENAIEGICVLSREGKPLSVNPAFAAIYGFSSPAAMIENVPESLASLYASPECFMELLEKARSEGTVSDCELEMTRSDGSRIWVKHNIRAISEGPEFHFEGSMADVTERHRAAEELRTLNAGLEKALNDLSATQQQVIQQERLRALGEMASGVAHDFNNALTPILGYSELMVRCVETLSPKELTDHLKTVITAATDAASVVSRLREFYRTKVEKDALLPLDLNALSQQVVTLTQPRWKDQAQARGVTINVFTELEDGLAPIDGDASALRELLTNLIFNAVDAMPTGGSIRLRTRCSRESSIVEVIDSGSGMTEEIRRRCLEPFFSTKGPKGTGLGLSMCFGIVKRHHGSLDIISEPGKGSTFQIAFPVSAAVLAGGLPSAKTPETSQKKPLRILVVDDEKSIRLLLGAILKGEGHQVTTADDGKEGLRQFEEGQFDLVITDKSMPGMNGDQLASAVKKASPGTPVILLTGFGKFIEESDMPDVDVVASKPISIQSLKEAVATATALPLAA